MKKSLAAQVDELACRFADLDFLAGEMLATIRLNIERGQLAATSDEGKAALNRMIGKWSMELSKLTTETP